MPENPSYLDRLYNEIGQYGDRLKATFGGSGGYPEIVKNWTQSYRQEGTTPSAYDLEAEKNRLKLQQAKEEYMAQRDAGMLSEDALEEAQAIREGIGERLQRAETRTGVPAESYDAIMRQQTEADPYLRYLEQNKAELQQPGYAAPTREEYQKYFVEKQAPPKAEFVSAAATGQPRSQRQGIPTLAQVPEQPQRPRTIREQIAMIPFEGDRYEATRKVMEGAKKAKINEAYAYADAVYGGVATVEGGRFIDNTLKQIEANYVVPKPIEETEGFKSAQQALVSGKHADRLFMLGEMKGLLETAKTIKDKNERVSFLELNLPKLAQSIAAGADAIQPAEAARIMPELNSVWQSPSQAVELLGRKGLGAFSKQPDVFIEKLGKVYNSTIPVVNERTASYQDNLGSAFKKLGIGYLAPIGLKSKGIDMTKLQQLREGTQTQGSVFTQTNPADRPASKGPQIVPGMRGVVTPGSFTYGSKPMQLGF
jgi:hypothetical protein